MRACVTALRRLDDIIWAAVALVAVMIAAAAAVSDFNIALTSFVATAGLCALLKLAAAYYRDRRNEHHLASAFESTAQLVAFAAVAAPLSYVAACTPLPLQDAALAHLDRALGFDWKGLLDFMHRSPRFLALMHLSYMSLSVQMMAAIVLLSFTGRLMWLRTFMLAFVIATLVTIAVSALLPAEGAWLHYGIKGDALPLSHTSWPVFFGLRDGSFRMLMAPGAEGVITFPSLHAALAALLAAALWPVPVARWIALAVNSLMLVATPIDGSHYFADVLAGVAIAALSLAVARAVVARVAGFPAAMELRTAPVSPRWGDPGPVEIDGQMSR